MALPWKNSASFGKLVSTAFGSITGSYTTFGSAFTTPYVLVGFKNLTNGTILVSTDGTNDYLVFPAQGYGIYDVRSNAPDMTPYFLPEGTQLYIKYSGSAPSSGSFYMESLILNKATVPLGPGNGV